LQITTKLARCYPSLNRLFKKYLGVKNATPETVFNELRSVIAGFEQTCTSPLVPKDLARRVTDLLLAFKPFTLPPSVLQALRSEKLWPRRSRRNGVLNFARITDQFFIPDNEYFLELFQEEVPILELTPTEVAALKPLFVQLEMENKFLSSCVTEIASANDVSLPAEDLSRELSGRAQALLWYASNRLE
jgi:hypothetical protein